MKVIVKMKKQDKRYVQTIAAIALALRGFNGVFLRLEESRIVRMHVLPKEKDDILSALRKAGFTAVMREYGDDDEVEIVLAVLTSNLSESKKS